MGPTPELLRQLRREEIADARQQDFAQKFLAGAELFDYACSITTAGIRMQNPTLGDRDVLEELRRRVALSERLEKAL